jgi:hypothetical protein
LVVGFRIELCFWWFLHRTCMIQERTDEIHFLFFGYLTF